MFRRPTRRAVVSGLAAASAAPLTRAIPASGETIPLVGLGSWITFNVGEDPLLRAECADVLRAFFAAGGRMVDSSPMYASSQVGIGKDLAALGRSESAVPRRQGLDLRRRRRTGRRVGAAPGRAALRPASRSGKARRRRAAGAP